ncbi:hypothetical protein FNL55_00355 [Tardiphaga sp. vice352]|uniref:hypothetical protein n=1 Tax=unclassified Tardiphaga TaxID=2631404 RepID=UPI001163DEDA|nr:MULTISPECIES: hypothetical protein [unclassified Tardiphaga]MBC7578934.1 hypothetical protein [Tardiphaga sp.]QDM14576.1 hypothetical protein FNL53_00360 [Tardiphaga sp. vice278]QDM24775.1 hypothetical protein FNL56_00370 [Tardiphaga sp. vice304]QDM29964.1 hypothetical protein FNL55_00355 [Tardiphaga sp. vice352]
MSRRKSRPNQSNFNFALRFFTEQGISPRIVYHPNGSVVIESAATPLSLSATDYELDAELKMFTEKHCEI